MEYKLGYKGEALLCVKFDHIREPVFIPCMPNQISQVLQAFYESGGAPKRKVLYRVLIRWKDKRINANAIPTFSKKELEEANETTMAHVLVKVGVFKSAGEAKRNGWNKPIEVGEYCVTKRKVKFIIIK